MKQTIYIDSRSNIAYSSFYLKGLYDMYGRKYVKFSSRKFTGLPDIGKDFRFIVEQESKQYKVFIHTNDSYKIKKEHYEWCDVYGSVNANFTYYPKSEYPKLVSLAPSFAIKQYSVYESLWYSLYNLLLTFKDVSQRKSYNKYHGKFEIKPINNIKRFVADYLKNSIYRLPLELYSVEEVIGRKSDNYIFFLSTLWYNDDFNKNDEKLNRRRTNFIEACKEIDDCFFEGGLIGDDMSSKEKFKKSLYHKRMNFSEWLEKTKQSRLVFNTPAFWDCHGWKLGEYLALGKAIISTPLSNDLPSPLIHGKHIHFIKDSSKETIKDAIRFLLKNNEYRQSLEKNAKLYWEEYCTPEQSLSLLGLTN